jgi:hypothetical protein
MNLADELAKLNELHFSGVLNDAEFEKAKAALLNPTLATPEPVQEQLTQVRYQNELARIDREWENERLKYLVRNRYGIRQVPTAGIGIAAAVVGGVFGTLWTIMAIAITGSAPNMGPFSIVKIIFPLFGVCFIVFGIAMGIYVYRRTQQYQERFQAYQARRQSVRSDDFR